MNASKPEEFISLKSGQSQNFAEIYDKKWLFYLFIKIRSKIIRLNWRLIDPKKCRFGPRYGASCSFCSNQTVQNHGITLFSKLRINLDNLTVISKALVLYFQSKKTNLNLNLKAIISDLQKFNLVV